MRRRVEIQAALVYLGMLFAVMTLLFTFPAMRGSMLHSSSALVAFFAVAVPPGLDTIVGWIGRRRKNWNVEQAGVFFRAGFTLLALVISSLLFASGVWGLGAREESSIPLWNERDIEYAAMDEALDGLGVEESEPVLTIDPPSWVNETGRRSVYLPTESVEAVFEAAARYGARYLVLQFDHPRTLDALYKGQAQVEGLRAVARAEDALGRPVTLFEVRR
jgi:hypothetical protein